MRFFWKHFFRNARRSKLDSLPDLFPLRHHFAELTPSSLGQDIKAALNVLLLSVPQGMAYATIAGLPIDNGRNRCAHDAIDDWEAGNGRIGHSLRDGEEEDVESSLDIVPEGFGADS